METIYHLDAPSPYQRGPSEAAPDASARSAEATGGGREAKGRAHEGHLRLEAVKMLGEKEWKTCDKRIAEGEIWREKADFVGMETIRWRGSTEQRGKQSRAFIKTSKRIILQKFHSFD
ncbi:hypothetical protein HPP92_025550 [Vanilla planifolia]|uniref:Uncharacterized protein n=1 Tax=Vanilla planifolia TaxID=51239 RepID=A0A835PFK9_VANPL|nr:hypothetical protein HPP92_025550 [Vanilla planifolia]